MPDLRSDLVTSRDLHAGRLPRRAERAPGLGVLARAGADAKRLVPPAQPRRPDPEPLHRRRRHASGRRRARRDRFGQGHRRADAGGRRRMNRQTSLRTVGSSTMATAVDHARARNSFAAAARLFDRADARERRDALCLVPALRRRGRRAGARPRRDAARHATGRRDSPSCEPRHAQRLRRPVAPTIRCSPASAEVVRRHAILPLLYLEQHLAGFAMDVEGRRYGTFDGHAGLLLPCGRRRRRDDGAGDGRARPRHARPGLRPRHCVPAHQHRARHRRRRGHRPRLPAGGLADRRACPPTSHWRAAAPTGAGSGGARGCSKRPSRTTTRQRAAWPTCPCARPGRSPPRAVCTAPSVARSRKRTVGLGSRAPPPAGRRRHGWLVLAVAQALGSRLRRPPRGSGPVQRPA